MGPHHSEDAARMASRVVPGIADATNYEVAGGLQEGETVALPGETDLRDGMAVKIVNTDTSYIRGRTDAN